MINNNSSDKKVSGLLEEAFGYDGSKCQKCSRKQTTEAKKRVEKEIPQIALRYKDKDFGRLELEKVKDGVLVSIKRGNDFLTYKSHNRFDFWSHDAIVDRLFKYIKSELGDQYPNFISVIKPQIEDMLKLKKKKEKTKTEEEFDEEALELMKEPDLLVEITEDLGKSVVKDNNLKNVVLLTGVSAYGPNPLNLFLEGPSSAGKSYVVVETLEYFPKKDVLLLGDLSPTALVHDYGEIEDRDGEKVKVIDLTNKIIVFLEKPHNATIKKLLPIMSHDVGEIEYRVTDKNAQGQHVTTRAIIKGFPAFIFCTTETETFKELSTRNLLYAPEITEEKIKVVLELQNHEAAYPWKHRNINNDFKTKVQKGLAMLKFNYSKAEVAVLEIETVDIPKSIDPRIMRDNKKRLELIKACARLHAFQRCNLTYDDNGNKQKFLLASFYDIFIGLTLYDEIQLSTETGLAPVVIEFFNKVLKPLDKEIRTMSYADMAQKYSEIYGQVIGDDTLRKNRINPLKQTGYVIEDGDDIDHRKKLFAIVKYLPTPQITGLKRVSFLSTPSAVEKAKKWFLEAIKMSDAEGNVYKGLSITKTKESDTDFSLHILLHMPRDIRYFSTLFPSLKLDLEDLKSGKLKNPTKSDNSEDECGDEPEAQIENEEVNETSTTYKDWLKRDV